MTDLAPKAGQLLEALADCLDAQIIDVADVDLNHLILTITLESSATQPGQFLLNFHSPTQQIWLSSPQSGAHHFQCHNGAWVSTKSSERLLSLLEKELTEATGIAVEISSCA